MSEKIPPPGCMLLAAAALIGTGFIVLAIWSSATILAALILIGLVMIGFFG